MIVVSILLAGVLLIVAIGLGLELRRERREWEVNRARVARAIGVEPEE